MDARTVAFLRELARADEEAAATLAELDKLAREVEAIRVRAAELDARLAALPADRERADASLADAERELAERGAQHQAAQVGREDAERDGDAQRLAAVRRAEIRARDRMHMAERRVARARDAVQELAAEAEAAGDDAAALAERARRVAATLRERPPLAGHAGEPPDETLEALAEWATQARAALFVARGRLAAEREAVTRQANELGAAVLGEPLPAQSAALVARRVERDAER